MSTAVFVLLFNLSPPSPVAGWEVFSKTTFEWTFVDEVGVQVEIPTFDEHVQSLQGAEIMLTGYYLPINISRKKIILSKLPYAACFFCGGEGGLESVAEVYFKEDHPRFKMDELVTVKGRLVLNDGIDGHLVFILVNATVGAQ